MSTLEIEGLTPRMKALADIMWSMDSEHDVSAFINTLPEDQAREARSVMHLMIWAMLDTVNETALAGIYLRKFRL